MRFARLLIAIAVVALIGAPAALALRFTDDSYVTPQGVVGQSYTHWFKGDGGCGPALPYQFRILNGSLPPGLSLAKSGLVSGTPTQAGSWSFWVELSDEDPPSATWCLPKKAEREFAITVVGGSPGPPAPQPPLTITTSSTPPGAVGIAYSLTLTADGGGTQSWSVTAGTFPPGLSLRATGAIVGVPTRAGAYTFTVQVRDSARSASKQLTINVSPALTIVTTAAPPGTVGVAYSLGLTADGGGVQTWSVTGGTLPPGLALNSGTGAVTGTPTTTGDYAFTVQVQDGSRSSSKQLMIVVRNPVTIARLTPPRAEVGVELKPMKLVATGGTGTYTWTLESGSVPGLSFDAATAELEGTPTAAGSFPVRLSATDGDGRTAAVDVILTVNPELTIMTSRLRVTRVGRPYSAALTTYGGVGPVKWKVVAGRFPIGIRLNKATGAIVGRPRHAGVYRLTFEARDALGVMREVTLRLTVLKNKKR
jgi:putative Ig domain-containing protein